MCTETVLLKIIRHTDSVLMFPYRVRFKVGDIKYKSVILTLSVKCLYMQWKASFYTFSYSGKIRDQIIMLPVLTLTHFGNVCT